MLSSVGHKAISATQRAVSQSSGRRIARVARKERGSAASRNVASFARPNAKLASPLATSNVCIPIFVHFEAALNEEAFRISWQFAFLLVSLSR